MEKKLFLKIFSGIQSGAAEFRFWDGTKQRVGKGKPYFTMTFKSQKALRALLRNASLGLGEGYMDGLIEVEGGLDQIGRLVTENTRPLKSLILTKLTKKLERNTKRRQKKQIERHYDLGNDFYKLWLDKSMTYTCAYFQRTNDSLEKAQQQKVEHVLAKLQIQKGQKLLDIGCGWGHLIITAAKKYGAKAHGVTLSSEQYRHIQERIKDEKLGKLVTVELMNYQDLAKRNVQYDRIVSVGFYEAVGRHNQHTYFNLVEKLLAPQGISVLHTISNQTETKNDPWIDKYIFPGGYIPALREVTSLLAEHGFWMMDYENLRMHYAKTLDEWLRRFEKQTKKIETMFDARFVRMWRFYLSFASAGFRYGDLSLSQIVFTKGPKNDLPLTRDHLYR